MSTGRLEEMLSDTGLTATERAELAELLTPLAAPTGEVPEPSAELAALFGERAEDGDPAPVPATRAARRWRVRTASVGAVVLAVSSVGATGLSAAANSLPSVVQHHVSQFSQRYLPFDFPEPPEESQPLGQGRMSRAPEVRLPNADDEYAGVGAEPPLILEGTAEASQAGPFYLTPGPAGAHHQAGQTPGPQVYAVPSATPAPTSAATPTPSATPSQSASDDQAGRPASPAASPTPTSGTAHPDSGTVPGQAGGHKPGKDEDPSPGKRPGKAPGKAPAPGKGKGAGTGTATGSGAGTGTIPDAGQADGGASEPPDPPATPEPSIVVPEVPVLKDLPDVPFAP